jgi:hypothetical protein
MPITKEPKNDGSRLVDLIDTNANNKVKKVSFNYNGDITSVNGKSSTIIPKDEFLAWADVSVAMTTAINDYSRELVAERDKLSGDPRFDFRGR